MPEKTKRIRNLSNPAISPLKAKWCQSFYSRLRGFTFRTHLEGNDGLVLVEAHDNRMDTAIHMFFLPTDLAVVWVNSNHIVVDIALAKAWHPFYASAKPARYVIEYHPNRHGDFQPGDQVAFEND